MESIEKLRSYAHAVRIGIDGDFLDLHAACNAIEAEIAERYIPLPLDRKDEPWHIGDKFFFDSNGTEHICTVSGIGDKEVFFYYDEHADSTKHHHFNAGAICHYKPRMLFDVLCEVEAGEMSIDEAELEIRDLLGVSE